MKREFPSKDSSKDKTVAGFTLLELLISVTLIGIMVIILASVLRLGYRSLEAGERKMDNLEHLRACFHVIEAQFLSQIPMTYLEEGEKKFYFEGKSDRLTFSTLFSVWEGGKGVVIVSYKITEEGQGRKALWVEEKPMGGPEGREIKLLDALSDASFAYYYQGPTNEQGQWLEEWRETAFLPRQVKVILFKNGEDLSWVLPLKTQPVRTTASFSPRESTAGDRT